MRALLLTAALLAVACKTPSRPGATIVGAVTVGEAALSGKPEISRTAPQLVREVQGALESTGQFVVRQGGLAHVHLEIEQVQRRLAPLLEGSRAPEREIAEVYLTLELTQGDADRLVAEGDARRPTGADDSLDPEARHAAFDSALQEALQAAVAALRDQVEARRKTDAQLLADLSAKDAHVRDYAIRVLADRRSPAAVPVLIERLHDENSDIVKRAAGALTAIGDRRAVVPMIELTRKRTSEQVGPLLYAIASLGGAEAEAFLYTLESGSPDEEVRRAARGAYADLVRRKREEARRTDPLPRNASP